MTPPCRGPVHRASAAFTLIEMLIVVSILAILAAIVVPYFTGASTPALATNVTGQLHTIRTQLQVYQAEHNGQCPTLNQLWGNMTAKTNADGTTTGSPKLGPYLPGPPANAAQGFSTTVIAATATPTSATGWVYDAMTGSILAAIPNAQLTTLGLTTNDCAPY